MRIAILIMSLLFCLNLTAQSRTDALGCPIGPSRTSQAIATSPNRIDKLVENLSTSGNTTFTSIVTRNKKTRAVEKVVKYAEITGSARKFVDAFEKESQKHDFLEKVEGGIKTINITIDGKKQKRIYIIQYEERVKHNATVTVIIHYK